MMVGGTVVDKWIWIREEEMIQVAVRGEKEKRCLGVDLVKNDNSLAIKNGDTIWWQGDAVYWTPSDNSLHDVKILRLSYSYGLVDCITPGRFAHNMTANNPAGAEVGANKRMVNDG